MRPAVLVLVVAGCSSRAPQPSAAPLEPVPAPVATTADAAATTPEPAPQLGPVSYRITADDSATWRPHKCRTTVWPHFDSYYEDDDDPPQAPTITIDEGACEGGCGQTLDDKLAELHKKQPIRGVCDARHRDALEAGLLVSRAPAPGPAVTAWDKAAPLAHRDTVRGALALTSAEEAALRSTGFVVPERLAYSDYTSAYYDVHRGQLPVYVTADSILHAVYASHDQLVAGVEKQALLRHLDAALGKMHCGLATAASAYPAEIANDLDLYLTIARSLLAGSYQRVYSTLGKVDKLAAPIISAIEAATDGLGAVEMFGRERALDATQFTPRGHYVGDQDLEKYFRAAMWLSRTEFNLASRGSRSSIVGDVPDPRETPREAVVALALADLVKRTGARAHIDVIEQAWSTLAGAREDVPLAELEKLRAKAGIVSLGEPDVAERLRAAIGDRFVRTVIVHPMPRVEKLPVIASLIGPRVTPDTVALGTILEERGPKHRAAEVAYMLGHDRALAYVDAAERGLRGRLDKSREHLARAPLGDDLYGHWLHAIRGLSHRPVGAVPSFMSTAAFEDLRLGSALAAYGQLRHNHVVIAAQVYDQGGCEIPDGYVEPAIETYRALAAYARRGRTAFRALDPKDGSKGVAYFTRLEKLMNVLVALSQEELSNRPLSADAKRFLSMIVERRESTAMDYNGSFPVATWDGWYIDLFPNIDTSFKSAGFVADYATYNREGQAGIHYLGAKGPRLGVFVVDVGGAPRMMVGPVANAFQHTAPLAKRLSDDQVDTIAGGAPWAAAYTAGGTTAPLALSVEYQRQRKVAVKRADPMGERSPRGSEADHRDPLPDNTLRLDSERDGKVTVELLDHHFVKLGEIVVVLRKGRVEVAVPAQARPIESLRIVAGDFTTRVDLSLQGYARADLGRPPRQERTR